MIVFLQLKLDFNKLHPGKESIFLKRWTTLKSVIIQHLQDKKIKDNNDKALVLLLKNLEGGEYQ